MTSELERQADAFADDIVRRLIEFNRKYPLPVLTPGDEQHLKEFVRRHGAIQSDPEASRDEFRRIFIRYVANKELTNERNNTT